MTTKGSLYPMFHIKICSDRVASNLISALFELFSNVFRVKLLLYYRVRVPHISITLWWELCRIIHYAFSEPNIRVIDWWLESVWLIIKFLMLRAHCRSKIFLFCFQEKSNHLIQAPLELQQIFCENIKGKLNLIWILCLFFISRFISNWLLDYCSNETSTCTFSFSLNVIWFSPTLMW